MFMEFKNKQFPTPLVIVMLGATIALFLSFFLNNFSKVSAHAAGMGGLVSMAIINTFFYNFDTFTMNLGPLGLYEISTNFVLMAVIILAGMVCSSRLLLGAHSERQLYIGFAVGVVSQFVAYLILR
jgi:hypothetical protein